VETLGTDDIRRLNVPVGRTGMLNEDAVGMMEKSVADGVKVLWERVGAVLWSEFKYFPFRHLDVGNYSGGAEFFFFNAVRSIPTAIQIAIINAIQMAIANAMLRMSFEEGFLGIQILFFSVGLRTAVLS
jgi:hypothetical protein